MRTPTAGTLPLNKLLLTAALVTAATLSARADTITWTSTSSGSWTDPANWSSNPNLPGPTDDVTIGDGTVGNTPHVTVTLDGGTTSVNSLTLLSGDTLNLNYPGAFSVATTLQIDDGTFLVTSGALMNTTVSFTSSTAHVSLVAGNLYNVTFDGNVTQLSNDNNPALTLKGTITNNGNWTQSAPDTTLSLNGNAIYIRSDTTLAGTGIIHLSLATIADMGSTSPTLIVGQNQTISGSADISALVLQNQGTIVASSPQGSANLSISIPANTTLTNSGLMEATARTNLVFNSNGTASIDNSGGVIACYGNGSTSSQSVSITGLSLTGGQLLTDDTGAIDISQSSLTNTSLSGKITLLNGNTLSNLSLNGNVAQVGANITLSGTITNNANWLQESSAAMTTTLNGDVTLNGNGTLHLTQMLQASNGTGSLSIGPASTVEGFGTFNGVRLLNSGTISTSSLNGFTFRLAGSTNSGTIAGLGGNLSFSGPLGAAGFLDNTGGSITVSGTHQISVTGITITGGSISSDATGAINLNMDAVIQDASLSGNILLNAFGIKLFNATLAGAVTQNTTYGVSLSGTITNNANWSQPTSGLPITLLADTKLTGNGTLLLNNGVIQSSNNASLAITGNETVAGNGTIHLDGDPTIASFLNAATINANVAAADPFNLTLAVPATNRGTLEATNGGALKLQSDGTPLNNANGRITAVASANGTPSTVTIDGCPVSGGQLSTDAASQILLHNYSSLANLSFSGNLVLNSSPVSLSNDSLSGSVSTSQATVILAGQITNNINSWTGSFLFELSGDVVLSGNGLLPLSGGIVTSTTSTSTLTVQPGQQLAGWATFDKSITLNNHGILNIHAPMIGTSRPGFVLNTSLASDGIIAVLDQSSLSAPQITLNGGILEGDGSVESVVLAGAGPHTIRPLSLATLTITSLTTNPNTTLAFTLTAPSSASSPSSNSLLAGTSLTITGGTLQITSLPTGPSSLGYYSLLQFPTLTGISSLTLPTPPNPALQYSLDTTRDPGYIDLHLGLPGDANDDGIVNADDLQILLNHFGQPTLSWSAGNFTGDPTIDLSDLSLLYNNMNLQLLPDGSLSAAPSSAPEPATLSLLALAAVPLVTRRRPRRHP